MKKEIRLRDLINVDYTDGDTPEDDQGMIPYQYIKRHRGQIGEDSLQTMHTNAWHEIIDNASPQVSETLMNISCNKQPGLLSGADKIKIDEILQQTSDVNLQKAIRTFMGTIENVVYDKEVNESNHIASADETNKMIDIVRKKIKDKHIKARVTKVKPGVISVSVTAYDINFTNDEQKEIATIGKDLNFTYVRGLPIKVDAFVHPQNFEFHYFVKTNEQVNESIIQRRVKRIERELLHINESDDEAKLVKF